MGVEAGELWLGGDQMWVNVSNEGDEVVHDVRLRLRFRTEADRPSSVVEGIRGYESDGTLLLARSTLSPGDLTVVKAHVPFQGVNHWTTLWRSEDGSEHEASGEITAG